MEASASLRWSDPTRSENIEQLVEALALAQGEIKSPTRNRSVSVATRQGGSYSFSYATLDAVIEAVRLPLSKNGLWFTQIMHHNPQENTYILDTRLLHKSGQWLACQNPLLWDGQGGNQQFGSALTFMKRYALSSLLGIAAEEDDDANLAEGNTITEARDRKPLPPKPDVMKAPEPEPVAHEPEEEVEPPKTVEPQAIAIPMKADESGNDWIAFGKTIMAFVRTASTQESATAWRDANISSLREMSKQEPKLYTNLSTSIIREINKKPKTS